jgi:hypothetical protein
MELDSLSLWRPALPPDDLRLRRLLGCPVPIVMAGGKRLRDDLRLRRTPSFLRHMDLNG